MELDRRTFIAGAVTVGATAAVAGLAACSPKESDETTSGGGESPKTIDYVQASANLTPVDERFVIGAVNITDAKADEEHEADYLVIGSGNSGLLSAARAAELGLKVIILEKASETGGSSFGTEAHFALDTVKYVKEQGKKTWTPAEALDYFNLYNEFRSTQSLAASYLNHSHEAFDWWIEKGAKVNQLLGALAGPDTGAGLFFEGRATALADIDRSVIEANGATVLTETKATNLVVDDSGAVVGALAENASGATVLVKSKATFVATGGFSTNPDMVNAYLGARGNAETIGDSMLYHNGDGINMMLGAGAITGLLDTTQPGGMGIAGIDEINTDPEAASQGSAGRAAGEPNLWVNKFGQRVGCEFWTNPTYGYMLAKWSPDYYFYSVLDSAMAKRMETEPFFCQSQFVPYTYDPVPDMTAQLDQAAEDGICYKADTIDELAEKAGINVDGIKATIAKYNEMCASKADTEFFKDAAMLQPISTAPYYAFKMGYARLSTLNGVMIDADCRVVDENGAWITGLFAGGLDSAGFFMADYNHAFSGSCSSYAFFTGFHSAEMAAEFIKG
ncbi:MAG: FAD-dependent oxidoreductase [Bifidobacteriaceae bacterium]|jgi:fumarate reductase flavoprotein subunit|nr:FAD-dependent oxidoreductase [Bifidobacteriaceae bacterium]